MKKAASVTALRDASFAMDAGDFVVVRGVSGSGKSTLLNILGCLDSPTSGTYVLDGAEVSHKDDAELSRIRSRKIGFIFQSFNLLPRTTAVQNVELPMIYADKAVSRTRAQQALARVGLTHRERHYASELSGGEQQRVAIARSLINDPALILADEPTGNLDESAGAAVMNILHELYGEGRTIILVTHDDAVANHARRVLLRHYCSLVGSGTIWDIESLLPCLGIAECWARKCFPACRCRELRAGVHG